MGTCSTINVFKYPRICTKMGFQTDNTLMEGEIPDIGLNKTGK